MSEEARAAIGSLVFFLVAPVVVAGLVPWLINGWETKGEVWAPVRVVGLMLVIVGGGVLAHSFVRFVRDGIGTPAPVAPTKHLVVTGVYRNVRNPMYVAVIAVIIGQGALFGDVGLIVYGAVVGLAMATFARLYEEPALLRDHGAEYEEYRANVPGWLPRLRPWRGDQ